MPYYLFKLSGESLDLGLQELQSLFWPSKLKILEQFGYYFLVQTNLREKSLVKILERSAFVQSCALVVKRIGSLLLEDLAKVDWSFVKLPFCVRAVDLEKASAPGLEARLAGPIYDFFSHHKGKMPIVSLENPKTIVFFFITFKSVFICKQIWRAKEGRFKGREPSQKPAFHPTSLKPKLALLLVNLSRAKPGKILLDPFCGAGSILIEAGLIGCKPIGLDLDEKMIDRSKINLHFYNVKAKLYVGNALALENFFKPNSIDAIATDPPYGRSTKIGAESLNALYKGFFNSAWIVLKKGAFMSLIYPHYVPAKKFINKKKWALIFSSELKVHGGLTRKFMVLQKR
ncbi:MAG: DNA methyltransferase [Candidatus Nanoarchaeia archaeon]